MIWMMMDWFWTPQGVNVGFVVLCLAAAFGLGGRAVALVSAALYLALVVMG